MISSSITGFDYDVGIDLLAFVVLYLIGLWLLNIYSGIPYPN